MSIPKQSVTIVSLLILAILPGCRKGIDQTSPTLEYDVNMDAPVSRAPSPGLLRLFPAPGDSSVDVTSVISVKRSPGQAAGRINFEKFVVYADKLQEVDGRYVYSDTAAEFFPTYELQAGTKYKVVTEGTLTIKIDNEVPETTQAFREEWAFVTDSIPPYIMWRPNSQVTEFARDGAQLVQFGDYLYLYGGWTGTEMGSSSYNDIYRSSGDLSVWEKLPDAPWQGRHTFGAGVLNNAVYIWGGDQNTDYFDVWKSNDGEHFEQVHQDLDQTVKSRLLYGTTVHQNKLYIIGGQHLLEAGTGVGDVWTSPNGFAWRRLSQGNDFLGKNVSGMVTSYNGKLWVIGGGVYGDPDSSARWSNAVYSSTNGSSWTREPDAPWKGRQYADVCVWDNKIWMIGGHNGKNLSEIWYMKNDGSWHQYQPSNLFVPRHASAVATYNNKLVIVCGDQNNECWVIEKVP